MTSLDDTKVIDQVEAYRQAIVSGQVPDRQRILQQFPGIKDQLNACLDAIDVFAQVARQFQEDVSEFPLAGVKATDSVGPQPTSTVANAGSHRASLVEAVRIAT